ncbi:polysaccharide deacetylase family protein [Lactococcus petauri]|uniref:polysaccharide deacetylase family protein n=1 Tax=Lactococcus petauri TaxID=1940789 RepID=UPI001F563385|nr:polysaccharide deacetylase family protein [Lactococcus petauri]
MKMKKNPLFWLPAVIGTLLSVALIVIGLSSFSSSKSYQKCTENPKITETKKAIDLAYKTRKKSDITKAQTYVNALNKENQKIYSDKVSKIEQDVEELNKINKFLNKLKNNITEQNLKEAKKAIDTLKDPYFNNEKNKFLNILNNFEKKYKNQFKGKKLIALTFDDGPNPTTTPQLLDILESKKVPVTFFALGENAQQYPEIIAQEAKNGHEVASHTWDHKDLQTLSREEQKKEILNANQLINKITGQDVSLYRPPYGSYNEDILKLTSLTIVNWSVDTNDWRYNTSEPVIENALNYVYDGSIILLHDIHPWSVEAVPQIIDTLHQQGYTFVTVSTLIETHYGKIKPQTAYFE